MLYINGLLGVTSHEESVRKTPNHAWINQEKCKRFRLMWKKVTSLSLCGLKIWQIQTFIMEMIDNAYLNKSNQKFLLIYVYLSSDHLFVVPW